MSNFLILITSMLMFFMPLTNATEYMQGAVLPATVENYTGKNTTIYVIDTGVDVNNKILEGKAINSDFQPLNFFTGTPDKKCLSHGTAVAAVAHKYAPDADIVSLRVLDCDGLGSDVLISQAIEHIINTDKSNKQKIINLSLNSWNNMPVFLTELSIEKATNAGIVVTIAAGNVEADSPIRDACLRSPSRVSNALTIGGYNPYTNDKAPYTAIGNCVDIYAPSDYMIPDIEEGKTVFKTGTSFASPYAAAMAARIFEQYPEAKPADVNATIANKSNFEDFIKMESAE